MGIESELKNLVYHVVAKSVTVIATVFIANNGMSILYSYVAGAPEGDAAVALSLIVSYKVWSDAIVPIVNDFFAALTPAKAVSGEPKKYFALV